MIGGKNKNIANNSCLTVEPLRGVIKAGEKIKVNIKLEITQREAQVLFIYKNLTETIAIDTNERDT